MSEINISNPRNSIPTVTVSVEDARMIKKIHRIVDGGKNAEVKKGKNGEIKVLKVTKEIA